MIKCVSLTPLLWATQKLMKRQGWLDKSLSFL